jgi:iron complex outermembrane receptor protein
MRTITIKSNRFALLALAPAVICAGLASQPNLAHGQDAEAAPADPFSQPEQFDDFEDEIEFFKVESDVVTSVSRHPESLWGAAAAIYVVTGEQMNAAGIETIADALRLVPGMDVASVDNNTQAISARGLNSTFADKMLVLLDGRTIYNPIIGGAIWHEWNQLVPDIDRIEVIRGPGGTLWGSNAMNGVVNIITKSAEDTQGGLVRATGGSNYLGKGEARYGGKVGDDFAYRLWGRYQYDKGFGGDGGDDVEDQKKEERAGFRFDWNLGKGLTLLSTGDFYHSRLGAVTTELSFDPVGNPIVARADSDTNWNTTLYTTNWRLAKDFADGSTAQLQMSGDYEKMSIPWLAFTSPAGTDDFTMIRRTFEAEAQHSFRLFKRNRVTWGANFRTTNVDINDSTAVGLETPDDTLDVAGAFLQNQIDLWRGAKLTLGSKVEYNSFTDTNVQPSARFAQRFDEDTTVWGAISRAVNTPAYGDIGIRTQVPSPQPFRTLFASGDYLDDTKLIAYEVGVRTRPTERIGIDLAAYYNDYDELATFSGETFGDPADYDFDDGDPTTVDVVILLDNVRNAYSYGVEAVLDFDVSDTLNGQLNATWQELSISGNKNPNVPRWKVNTQWEWAPIQQLSVVPTIYYTSDYDIGSIFEQGNDIANIDDQVRVDLAMHYQHDERWPTISVVGQNLTNRTHLEFAEELVRPATEVTRQWFVRVEQEF